MSHSLPKLDYAYIALERFIDARTMEIHHTKHHQTYIDKLNAALKGHEALERLSAENLIRDLNAVPETAAIACPVYGHGGELRGALNLSGIRERFNPKHVARLRQILGTAATELSRLLGATEATITRKEKVA